MKPFTPADKPALEKKITLIKRNLDMYKRYESQLLTLDGVSETMKETANKLPYLRKDKAREVYTIVKKYGWLGSDEIGDNLYKILLEAISYGDLDILLSILPYAKKGLLLGKISEDEFNKILDYINSYKSELENESKTLK